jgi:hypothetical protein
VGSANASSIVMCRRQTDTFASGARQLVGGCQRCGSFAERCCADEHPQAKAWVLAHAMWVFRRLKTLAVLAQLEGGRLWLGQEYTADDEELARVEFVKAIRKPKDEACHGYE